MRDNVNKIIDMGKYLGFNSNRIYLDYRSFIGEEYKQNVFNRFRKNNIENEIIHQYRAIEQLKEHYENLTLAHYFSHEWNLGHTLNSQELKTLTDGKNENTTNGKERRS